MDHGTGELVGLPKVREPRFRGEVLDWAHVEIDPDDDQGPIYGPALLATLGRVFDAEWEVMRPAFEGLPQSSTDAARTVMAKFALHLAQRGAIDPAELCEKLHRAMQHAYPSIRGRPPISFEIGPC